MFNFLDVAPYEFPRRVDPQLGLKMFIAYGSIALGVILAIITLVIVYKKYFKSSNKKNKKVKK